MKKMLIVFFMATLLLSCKSQTDKALKIIDREMFKTLHDYSSYEPIETSVDSAFTSIYRDSVVVKYALSFRLYVNLWKESSEIVNEAIENAQRSLRYSDIYSGSYYSRSEYTKYRNEASKYSKEAEEELEKYKTYVNMGKHYIDSVKLVVNDFVPKFIGWKVKHRFRSKNRAGNFSIGDYIYVIDPKFKKIIYKEDSEDEEFIEIRKLIDEMIESSIELENSNDDEQN